MAGTIVGASLGAQRVGASGEAAKVRPVFERREAAVAELRPLLRWRAAPASKGPVRQPPLQGMPRGCAPGAPAVCRPVGCVLKAACG